MSLVKKRIAQALANNGSETTAKTATDDTKKKVVVDIDLAKAGTDKTVILNKDIRTKIMKDFDMYTIGMDADLAQLKKFSDIEDKNQYKSEALTNTPYLEYVDDYVASGANHPNSVLAWVFIWLIDLKRWNKALELLPLMVEQKQPLPTRFNTKHWGIFVVDQLYTEGVIQLEKGLKSIENSNIINPFYQTIALAEKGNWDLGEVVGGKLYAMAGKLEHIRFNFGNAIHHYIKAQIINDKAGVKKAARDIAKMLSIEIEI
jgi:hypothetical protein